MGDEGRLGRVGTAAGSAGAELQCSTEQYELPWGHVYTQKLLKGCCPLFLVLFFLCVRAGGRAMWQYFELWDSSMEINRLSRALIFTGFSF